MPRIRSNTKMSLKLGTPAVEYNTDLTSYLLDPQDADGDIVTFSEAGGATPVTWHLTGTGVQNTDTAAFWAMVWAKSGQTVAGTLAPFGNATPTPAQPHYAISAKIGKKPPIGGAAALGNGESFTFDFDWELTSEPLPVTA